MRNCCLLLKKYRLPQVLRQNVWETYAGNVYKTKCFCCEKNEITPFRFECAHITAEVKGGKNATCNLLPSCSPCNKSMGTMNLYVFKSKIHNNLYYDPQNISDVQKTIIEFYNMTSKNISCQKYIEYFDEWKDLLAKCISVSTENNNNICINKFKCSCGFEFRYITKKDEFGMTSQNSKSNIIDIICDHIPCLITKKKFTDGTLNLRSYQKWLQNNIGEETTEILSKPKMKQCVDMDKFPKHFL